MKSSSDWHIKFKKKKYGLFLISFLLILMKNGRFYDRFTLSEHVGMKDL